MEKLLNNQIWGEAHIQNIIMFFYVVWLKTHSEMTERSFACAAADLVDDGRHELWVGLLIGQELPDDLVHDVLRGEEVVQELGQNPGHHASLAGETFTDPDEHPEQQTTRGKQKQVLPPGGGRLQIFFRG